MGPGLERANPRRRGGAKPTGLVGRESAGLPKGRDMDHREVGVESRWSSLFLGGTDRREGLDRVVTRRGVSLNLPPTGGLRSASTARRFFGWGRVQAGFSLLEALFVVAILGILLALAFPSYQRVVMERRVQNTAREIAGLFRAAQQAAVAKSAEAACVRVEIGVNSAQAIVVPGPPTASSCNGQGEALLASQAYPPGVQVSPQSAVAFLPSGEVQPPGFQVRVHGGGQERYVCVNPAGLVTVPPAGQDCSTQ
jgi:prepilin-type N-terminal cleavage/methylation domain-containing protein